MTFLGLVARNLRGAPLRSLLTVLSSAVLMLLFTAWLTIVRGMEAMFENTRSHPRVAVHHRTSFVIPLPESYLAKIGSVDGVEAVTPHAIYGGQGPDETFLFPTIATDPAVWPIVFSDFWPSADLRKAWVAERTGAVIGSGLVEKFGWKVGQQITLRGILHPVDLRFKIVGVLPTFLNPQIFLLHKKYLEEAVGARGVNMYWAKVATVDDIPRVAAAIDRMFENSPAETMSESERDLYAGFMATQSQIISMVRGVGPLVLLIIIVVCGNTMGMAVSDRTRELAVMKCLGFTPRFLLTLILAEGALLSAAGGLIGSIGTWVLFQRFVLGVGLGPLSHFDVDPGHVISGVSLSLVVGLAAAGVPAVLASRLSPSLALRQVK